MPKITKKTATITETVEVEVLVVDTQGDVETSTNTNEQPVIDADGVVWDERADVDGELFETGKHLYRCSMLGDCHSTLVAYAMEEETGPPPANIRARMDEGTRLEGEILRRAREKLGARPVTFSEIAELKEQGIIAGYNHAMQQVQVRAEVGSSALLFGHLDQLVYLEKTEEYVTLEVKALGPDLWKIWRAGAGDFLKKAVNGKYEWQVSGVMMGSKLPLVFVCGEKQGKDVDGDEGTTIGAVTWWRFDEPPIGAGKIKARILKAEKDAKAGVIPACDEARFGCPYFHMPFHEKKEEVKIEWVQDEELTEWVRAYHVAREDEKYAKGLKDDAKDQIEALLKEREGEEELGKGVYGVEDEAHNKFKVRWVKRNMPARAIQAGVQSFPEVKLIEDPRG